MYNNNFMLDRLSKQKEEIENLIKNYQNVGQQTPVNNFINANPSQITPRDTVEWRVLNENEEVDNLYVANKTLFVGDNLMILKGVDGSLQKWNITKIYPIDKKDEKINALEEEIRKLKEVINNEHTKPTSTVRECIESNADDDEHVKFKPKTSTKPIPKQE